MAEKKPKDYVSLYEIQEVVGDEAGPLRKFLREADTATLERFAGQAQARYPDSYPTSRSRDALIKYCVEHIAMNDYPTPADASSKPVVYRSSSITRQRVPQAPAERTPRMAEHLPERQPGEELEKRNPDTSYKFDAFAPLDARKLQQVYGDDQLGAALAQFGIESLRQAAEGVGVKPSRAKAETVKRITEKLTNNQYHANFSEKAVEAAEVKAPRERKTLASMLRKPDARKEDVALDEVRQPTRFKARNPNALPPGWKAPAGTTTARPVTRKPLSEMDIGTKLRFADLLLTPIISYSELRKHEFSAIKAKDPFELKEVFGEDQYVLFLRSMDTDGLRDSVDVVKKKTGDTRKVNKNNRAEMIRYIVGMVDGTLAPSGSAAPAKAPVTRSRVTASDVIAKIQERDARITPVESGLFREVDFRTRPDPRYTLRVWGPDQIKIYYEYEPESGLRSIYRTYVKKQIPAKMTKDQLIDAIVAWAKSQPRWGDLPTDR